MDSSSGRTANRKPTSSSPVRSKSGSQQSHLTREIREQISHLRTELSSQRSSNQHLLREKILQLKEAQNATKTDGNRHTALQRTSRDSAAATHNGHGKVLQSDGSSASNRSLLRLQRSSFGGTFDLDQSSVALHQAQSGDAGSAMSPERSSRDRDSVRHSSMSSSTSFHPLSQDLDDVTDSNDGSISGRTWILDGPTMVCGASSTAAAESNEVDSVDSVDHEEKIAALTKMLRQTLSTDASRQNTTSARGKTTNKINSKDDKETEKQWQLQKKVFDLTSQMSQLDKRLAALKEENEILKKKGEDVKTSEEKIKQLKRRNTDLAAIVRKLDDRVKQLQQESAKQPKDVVSPSHNASRNGRTVVRDKSKVADDKDKTIESLRDKCQELLRLLGSQQKTFVQYSSDCYSDTNQLELMVKQAAKERLQLERRLADCQRVDPVIEAKLERLAQLEDINSNLENEVSQMSEELLEKESMEIELVQRGVEVEMLNKELDETKQRCSNLEKELSDVLDKNTELAVANSDMQHQIVELEQVKSQYGVMESKLKSTESEVEMAKLEASRLNNLVEHLQRQLQVMADEQIKSNADKLEALNCARQKQQELDDVTQAKERQETEYKSKVDMLEGQVTQLQHDCKEQEVEKLRLVDEVNQLKEQRNEQLTMQSAAASSSHNLVDEKQNNLNRNNLNRVTDNNEMVPGKVLTNGHVSPSEHVSLVGDSLGVDQNDFNGNVSSCRNALGEEEVRDDQVNEGESPAHLPFPVRVFVVLYDYDPEQSSPNDQPDLELYLRTGDYVFIYGDMDEDGFYEGELTDGRRGLVPSNFISPLNDDDAAELLAMIADHSFNVSSSYLQMALQDSSVNSTSFLQGLDTSIEDFDNGLTLDRLSGHKSADPPFSVQIESGPDLGSLIVSWLPVTITATGTSNGLHVKGYSVYVNGFQVKQLLNPTGDHVLLEYEDLCSLVSPRYITVRTLTMSGQESADSPKACLSKQMIRDITTELRSVSLQSASETSEIENRLSPMEAAVLRPVPFLPRATGFVNPVAMFSEPGHFNIQQNMSGVTDKVLLREHLTMQSNVDESVGCNVGRATSEPPDISLSNKELASVRSNTVPPLLDMVGNRDVNTVQCVVDGEVDVRRELGNPNVRQLTRSLVAVSNGTDGVLLNSNHRQQVSHERGRSETDDTRQVLATEKRPINNSTLWNPEPSLANPLFQQSSAYSMTALDRAPLSNYKADISPSSVTLGGGGVWRRVERRDSGLAAAPLTTVENFSTGVEAESVVRQQFNAVDIKVVNVQPAEGTLKSGSQAKSSSLVSSQFHNNAQPVNSQIVASRVSASMPLEAGKMLSSSTTSLGTERNLNVAAEDAIVTLCHVGSELIDNNAVTSHHLRDDIPDSELIDYSDDGGESLVDSSMCVGAEQVRIFVALFDYDPATMSPNPDAVDVEMPFHEGQLIQVYGDQDADGFYLGECNGRRGLIPSNMVSMVEVDDPDIALQLLRDSGQPALTNGSLSSSRTSSRTSGLTQTMSTLSHQGDGIADETVHYVVAIYNYNPQELSPNIDADQELAFVRGQLIAVYGDVDDDGFYFGEIDGRCGLVPSNFVQAAPLDYISPQC